MHLKRIANIFIPLHCNKITRPARAKETQARTQTDFVAVVSLQENILTQFF
jgi:hypothetical protein